MNDVQLMQLSAAGDQVAFGVFARRHGSYLLAVLRRFGLDESEAEDTAQQALMQAYRAAGRYDEERASPRSWITTIALNLARNHVRGRARFHLATERFGKEPVAGPIQPLQELEQEGRRRLLQQGIAALPDEQRAVLLLRLDGELAFADIGRQLGITPAAAKQRFHRATRTLKKELMS